MEEAAKAFTPESWARYQAWAKKHWDDRRFWVNNPDEPDFFLRWNDDVRSLIRSLSRYSRSVLVAVGPPVVDYLRAVAVNKGATHLLEQRSPIATRKTCRHPGCLEWQSQHNEPLFGENPLCRDCSPRRSVIDELALDVALGLTPLESLVFFARGVARQLGIGLGEFVVDIVRPRIERACCGQ